MRSLTMHDKDLALGVLDKAFQEARRDDIAFTERAAVYSLVRTLATDVRDHIDDDMGGHGYAHEQVTKIVWHIGAMLGFDVTNGHDKDKHASWAIGAMGVEVEEAARYLKAMAELSAEIED